jgi:hypothetical protein
LRPGFRPTDSYTVSFVFMHSGVPFAKKGGADLSLPSMDIPISLLSWEIFLPEQYKVKDFGGDVIAANRVPEPLREDVAMSGIRDQEARMLSNQRVESFPGQMAGYVTDPSGAVVPNARVTITSTDNGSTRTAVTDASGRWLMAGLGTGQYKATAESPGFRTSVFNLNYDAGQPSMYSVPLSVASTSETVEVTASSPQLNTETAQVSSNAYHGNDFGANFGGPINGRNVTSLMLLAPGASRSNTASANVMKLQQRVVGVLPVPIDVPRAGTSFSFVRPLVLDEETKVTFSYKSR